MRLLFCRTVALCTIALVAPVAGAEDLTDLFRRLPETANTIAVVNVKAVRQLSGSGPDATGYEIIAGMPVPPAVDLIMYASHFEPGMMDSRKTAALVRLNREVTLDDVADKSGGETIKIAGMSVVSHPRKGYYAMLSPQVIGIARNVSRQELVRWLHFASTNEKVLLHDHLANAVEKLSEFPIAIAVDLENMLEVKLVRQRLALSKNMEGLDKADIDNAAALVAGVKGLTMTVGGKGLDEAELHLAFSAPVGERGELVKSLFLEVLEDFGASIADFEKATVTAAGQKVILKMKMSSDGLTRVMSLFMPPPAPPPTSASPKLEANGISIAATRKYFETVDQILYELKWKDEKLDSYKRTAMWHDTYAGRIENMSTRYVDKAVVKFGESVAARLRVLSYSLRGMIVDVNALEGGKSIVAVGGGGWFGGSGVAMDSNISKIASQQAEIIRKDNDRRMEIWQTLDSERRNTMKMLRDIYKLNIETLNR
jgi:hypothetical protein